MDGSNMIKMTVAVFGVFVVFWLPFADSAGGDCMCKSREPSLKGMVQYN
jgi:hypothetical protein